MPSISGTGDLFSAIFLGKYLITKDVLAAAKSATSLTGLAVKNSVTIKSDELMVPSVYYRKEDAMHSIKIVDLNIIAPQPHNNSATYPGQNFDIAL